MFGDAMTSTGLSSYAYTPPSQLSMSEWPTLQELIDAGTRLVMFLGQFPFISEESQLKSLRLRCEHERRPIHSAGVRLLL
jgi:type VI protein secretion system component VasF